MYVITFLNPSHDLFIFIANAGGEDWALVFLLSTGRPPAPYQTPEHTHPHASFRTINKGLPVSTRPCLCLPFNQLSPPCFLAIFPVPRSLGAILPRCSASSLFSSMMIDTIYRYTYFCSSHFYFPASGQAVVTGVVPSSPRFLPLIFIAHRVQQSHCSSIFHRVLLTHALALSASQFVHKKKSHRTYTSMLSAGLELTKLTYTGLEDNLIRHRGDRHIPLPERPAVPRDKTGFGTCRQV